MHSNPEIFWFSKHSSLLQEMRVNKYAIYQNTNNNRKVKELFYSIYMYSTTMLITVSVSLFRWEFDCRENIKINRPRKKNDAEFVDSRWNWIAEMFIFVLLMICIKLFHFRSIISMDVRSIETNYATQVFGQIFDKFIHYSP